MVDPKIAAIVSAGYSETQARQALAENNDDVDDAIDDLFLKGRLQARNASTKPVFNADDVTVTDSPTVFSRDDVTVTDSLPPSHATTRTSFRATPAFPLMAMRTANSTVQKNAWAIEAIQECTTEDDRSDVAIISSDVRPSHGTARVGQTINRRVSAGEASAPVPSHKSTLRPPSAAHANKQMVQLDAKAPPPTSLYKGKEVFEKKKSGLAGFDQGSFSSSSTDRDAGQASRQENSIAPIPPMSPPLIPGAFAVGMDGAASRQGNDDDISRTPESPEPPALQNVTAELVDPDQENQLLEQRLQEELERERRRTAVAQVVDEEELKTCRWRRVVCVVGFVLVAFAVALGVALTRPPPETPVPTPAPTMPPPPQEIFDLIAPVSFDGGESLYDPFSPQSEAAWWLANNINLSEYSDVRKLQRYAMATLYFSTNGDEWVDSQNWLTDEDECLWFSENNGESVIECDSNGILTYLESQKNNLVGTLPDEIAFLSTAMVELKLNKNDLQGSLPSTIGEMTRLQFLELHENKLSKPIPTEYGQLTLMEEFLVYKNGITGTLPSEMALMTSLAYLRVEENELNGTISPTLISSWLMLEKRLAMSDNRFTGTIPTEIGLLTLLEELELDENRLTGGLPTEIGLMTTLEGAIKINKNFLTGPLPTELGLLTGISDELRLDDNGFTGSIPTEFALLTLLVNLGLGDNVLTGTIPSFIATFGDLDELELQNNSFTGSIPAELGMLTKMTRLKLDTNNLTGTIPSEFMQFPELQLLAIQNCSLTGTVPPFGNLAKLEKLLAQWNMLTGSIPESIAILTNLQKLDLTSNMLTGTVPQAIFELPLIETIHLYNNSFVGDASCPQHIETCLLSCPAEDNATCRTLPS